MSYSWQGYLSSMLMIMNIMIAITKCKSYSLLESPNKSRANVLALMTKFPPQVLIMCDVITIRMKFVMLV